MSHRHFCLKNVKILKTEDTVEIHNCVFLHSFLRGKLPNSFENFFLRCNDVHTNQTRFSNAESLYMPHFKSVTYGMNSITNICINSWNNITEILEKPSTLSISELKKKMFELCIAKY